VVVLDAHPAGGRARTTPQGGFRFNQGAHALYLGGHGHRVLAGLGIHPTGGLPARDSYVATGGKLHELPGSPAKLLRTSILSVRAKAQLGRLLGGVERLDAAALSRRSVAEWFDDLGLRPDARALVETILRVATYVNAPELLSAEVAVQQLQLVLAANVLYMDGGWQWMVDRLRDGLDVREGVPAQAVRREGHDLVIDGGAGGPVVARAVVVAVGHPAEAHRLTGFDFAAEHGLGPPAEVACLDLGVRHAPRHPVVFPMDRPLYLSTHCPPAELAPAGHSVVQLMHYLPVGSRHEPAATRTELEGLALLAGIEHDAIVESRYLHRMVAVPAIPTASEGGLAGRPGVAVRDTPGLFVAGDWVGGRSHLADASFASAEEAAAAVDRHLARVPA